jgi:hypothetical protein
MEAIAVNPTTGEKSTIKLDTEQFEKLKKLQSEYMDPEKLRRFIDKLDLSAEAKMWLEKISKVVITIGTVVINVGKKILELAIMLFSNYPQTAFGVVLGALLGTIASSIPILGFLFGAVVMPVCIAFGLVKGYMADLKDHDLDRKIKEATSMFEPLREK